MNLDLSKINKVYLAGIGGIGLSSLAYYFLQLDKKVLGSDLQKSVVTEKLAAKGVFINYKQKASNITADLGLLIYSSALPLDHVELVKARKLKIPILSYFEFLGFLSKKHKTIAIAGTNGKTTTTAMLGLIMEKAGFDPTVIVGSLVPQWGTNFRFGKSNWLVVEACEWQAHMLEINPKIIVLTNVAEDHLDYFKDLADIKKHFQQFINKLPSDGLLCKNADDKNSSQLNFAGKLLQFGQSAQADYRLTDISVAEQKQKFTLRHQQKKTDFVLGVPGTYNAYNAAAATVVAKSIGINEHQIWNALNEFNSTWRRFERLGTWKNNLVISDYAHHPDAIAGLVKAAKDFYPNKKIIAIFQPHHHNRTKTLLKEFAQSLSLADYSIIADIYQVRGREDEMHDQVSSQDLVKLLSVEQTTYAPKFVDIKKTLRQLNPTDSVLLFIGAGDIDNLARELIK